MVEYSRTRVASNTGPLVSAFQCERHDLLERYFEAIVIPESVSHELIQQNYGAALQQWVDKEIVTIESLTVDEIARATRLAERITESSLTHEKVAVNHLPEAEAIVLASRDDLQLTRLLIEERAGRRVAGSPPKRT